MNGANKHTVIVIDNKPFWVDTVKRKIREWNKPANNIGFDELHDEGDCFSIRYNKTSGKVASYLPDALRDRNELVNVIIPLPLLSNNGIRQSVQDAINENSKAMNWGIYVADEDVAIRLSGRLPHIDLAGNDYTVDWRLKELRETAKPWKQISLEKMAVSNDGESFLCFYDTEKRSVYQPETNITVLPPNVVLLEIPNELKLDPVAVAREHGLGDAELLHAYPIQKDLKATVKPLLESGLPKMIEDNLRKANKKSQKRKRGKGL